MEPGTLLAAAKRDTKAGVTAALVFVVLCAGVLALNWKYVYNFVAGPVPFSGALAADPGPREWVRVDGPLIKTGLVEERTLRLFRGLAESKSTSANYLGRIVDGKLLIVKVEPEFSGSVAEGRLQPLPEVIRADVGADAVHPWLVDATTGYRWDFNLFVMIAGPLLPLALIALAYTARQAGNVEKHSALARLKPLGTPQRVLQQIETDLKMAGPQARVGQIWMAPKWLVATEPFLTIVPAQDLIGIGSQTKTTKSGAEYNILVWERQAPLEHSITVSEADAGAAMTRASATFPWAVVNDIAAYQKRWVLDRDACQREADARRK